MLGWCHQEHRQAASAAALAGGDSIAVGMEGGAVAAVGEH
jgi:hypothetical protein